MENCVINNSNIDSIAFYIKWKSDLWREIRFINCGLNEKDLKRLIYFRTEKPFFSLKYSIFNFFNRKEFDIDDMDNW